MDKLVHDVTQFLYGEAACLDEKRWDDWLALYTEDCEFWIPAWKGEHEVTADPAREVSLIYYDRRARLEERVSRIRSGISAASTPLPRTVHFIGNVRLGEETADSVVVHANWQTHAYRFQSTETIYGRSEYLLVIANGQWRIRRKKVILVNDVINTVLDIYHV